MKYFFALLLLILFYGYKLSESNTESLAENNNDDLESEASPSVNYQKIDLSKIKVRIDAPNVVVSKPEIKEISKAQIETFEDITDAVPFEGEPDEELADGEESVVPKRRYSRDGLVILDKPMTPEEYRTAIDRRDHDKMFKQFRLPASEEENSQTNESENEN